MPKSPTNSLSHIKPTPGNVFIAPEAATKQTASGIYLPDTASGDKPQQGTVLAVGDAIYADGKEILPPAKAGDKIIYKKWGGNEVKIDNKDYVFVKFEDILALI